MSDGPDISQNSFNACSNPGCQYIAFEHDVMKKKVEQELWRAGNAIARARALRACSAVILCSTALFNVIFSQSIWVRVAAAAMVLFCSGAMQAEG